MIGHNTTSKGDMAPEGSDDLSVRFRYMPLHIGDWLTGTEELTFEHRGFYIDFLVRLYNRGKPFPDDDRKMCDIFGVTIRVWRRLKDVLVSAGKILVRNCSLTNERFEVERRKRADEMRRKSASAQARWEVSRQNSAKTSAKLSGSLDEVSAKLAANSSGKLNKINELGVKVNAAPITEIRNLTDKEEKKLRHDARELTDLLEQAAGEALADPASAPGLLAMSEPNRWIEQGCDLEKDILPTVKARSAKARPRSIRSWSYFAQAVADAKADRLRPMPEGIAKALPSAAPTFQTFEQRKAAAEAARVSDMMMGAL